MQSQSSFFIKNPKIAALHHLDAGPQRLVFLFYPWRAFRRDGSAVAPQSRKYRGCGGTGGLGHDYGIGCRDQACPVLRPQADLLGEGDGASRVSTQGVWVETCWASRVGAASSAGNGARP